MAQAPDLSGKELRRITTSVLLEYACHADMSELICCLLGQGLQHFDVHPVLLASATLLSIVRDNQTVRWPDAVTLLEYVHSQFPSVQPKSFNDLLVAMKTKALIIHTLSNPTTHKRLSYTLLDRYFPPDMCRGERSEGGRPGEEGYCTALLADARDKLAAFISEAENERIRRTGGLLSTEMTFERKQAMLKDLQGYLGSIKSHLCPPRLCKAMEQSVPPLGSVAMKDFSIDITKCPLVTSNMLYPPKVPTPPSPFYDKSPTCSMMDKTSQDYDAGESESQPSDLDEGAQERTLGLGTRHKAMSESPTKQSRQLSESATHQEQPGGDRQLYISAQAMQAGLLETRTSGNPEFHQLSHPRLLPQRTEQSKGVVPKEIEVLQIAYQESDKEVSESDGLTMLETIAMRARQPSTEPVVSDTESETSPREKPTCLENIYSILDLAHQNVS